jgi:hypothetical protein
MSRKNSPDFETWYLLELERLIPGFQPLGAARNALLPTCETVNPRTQRIQLSLSVDAIGAIRTDLIYQRLQAEDWRGCPWGPVLSRCLNPDAFLAATGGAPAAFWCGVLDFTPNLDSAAAKGNGTLLPALQATDSKVLRKFTSDPSPSHTLPDRAPATNATESVAVRTSDNAPRADSSVVRSPANPTSNQSRPNSGQTPREEHGSRHQTRNPKLGATPEGADSEDENDDDEEDDTESSDELKLKKLRMAIALLTLSGSFFLLKDVSFLWERMIMTRLRWRRELFDKLIETGRIKVIRQDSMYCTWEPWSEIEEAKQHLPKSLLPPRALSREPSRGEIFQVLLITKKNIKEGTLRTLIHAAKIWYILFGGKGCGKPKKIKVKMEELIRSMPHLVERLPDGSWRLRGAGLPTGNTQSIPDTKSASANPQEKTKPPAAAPSAGAVESRQLVSIPEPVRDQVRPSPESTVESGEKSKPPPASTSDWLPTAPRAAPQGGGYTMELVRETTRFQLGESLVTEELIPRTLERIFKYVSTEVGSVSPTLPAQAESILPAPSLSAGIGGQTLPPVNALGGIAITSPLNCVARLIHGPAQVARLPVDDAKSKASEEGKEKTVASKQKGSAKVQMPDPRIRLIFPVVGLNDFVVPPPYPVSVSIEEFMRFTDSSLRQSPNQFYSYHVLDELSFQLPLPVSVRSLFPVETPIGQGGRRSLYQLAVWPEQFCWTPWVTYHVQRFLLREIQLVVEGPAVKPLDPFATKVALNGGDAAIFLPPGGILCIARTQEVREKLMEVVSKVLQLYRVTCSRTVLTTNTVDALGVVLIKRSLWAASPEVRFAFEGLLQVHAMKSEHESQTFPKTPSQNCVRAITRRRFGALCGVPAWFNWLSRTFLPKPQEPIKTLPDCYLNHKGFSTPDWDGLTPLSKKENDALVKTCAPNTKLTRVARQLNAIFAASFRVPPQREVQKISVCCDVSAKWQSAIVVLPSKEYKILFSTAIPPQEQQFSATRRLLKAAIAAVREAGKLQESGSNPQGKEGAKAPPCHIYLGVSSAVVQSYFNLGYCDEFPDLCIQLLALTENPAWSVFARHVPIPCNPAAVLARIELTPKPETVSYLQRLSVMAEMCLFAPTNSFGQSRSVIDRGSILALQPPVEHGSSEGVPNDTTPSGGELQESTIPEGNTSTHSPTVIGQSIQMDADQIAAAAAAAVALTRESQVSRKRSREPSEAGELDAVDDEVLADEELANDAIATVDEEKEASSASSMELVEEAAELGDEETVLNAEDDAVPDVGAEANPVEDPLPVFTNWWEPV